MDILKTLKELSDSTYIGHHKDALKIAEQMLGDFSKQEMPDGSAAYYLDSGSDKTIILEAHIDEIGFVVTEVFDSGFLRVAAVGGLDVRTLPSHRVLVHGKEEVVAVFTSIPPHLSKGETVFDDIDKLYLDTGLGAKAKELVSVGDFATYNTKAQELKGGYLTGKALDNRAGVTALLLVFEMLKGKDLPFNVVFLLCANEELGKRGAVTAAFGVDASEAICVDVSFGNIPGLLPSDCGQLGDGPMIGVSPVLDCEIGYKLSDLACNNNIPAQSEIMAGNTSTDADVISISRGGIKTGLLSIPLRNMHTDCEMVCISDIEATARLIYEYIVSGGAFCD